MGTMDDMVAIGMIPGTVIPQNAELGSRRDLSAFRYVGLHDGGDDGAVRRRLITRGMERRRIERALAGKIESVWFPMICRASL